MARNHEAQKAPQEKAVSLPPRMLTKQEFGRRIEKLMIDKGWNQSELARQASKHAAKPIGRDLISNYIKGDSFPRNIQLNALAAALKLRPEELLPNMIASSADNAAPTFEMREVPDTPGTVWLRLNRAVSFKIALEIAQLLETDK